MSPKKKFEARWKAGYNFKTPAPEAAQEVQQIASRNDGLATPRLVVAAARPKRALLHDEFTWDDTKAAESWRVQEARRLLNHLVIVEVTGGVEREVAPAFVSVAVGGDDESPTRGYVSVDAVLGDPELRQQAVFEALRGLEAWKRRYKHLSELKLIFKAVDQVFGQVAQRDGTR